MNLGSTYTSLPYEGEGGAVSRVAGENQGLTLVHFAAQPEPVLTAKLTPTSSVSHKECFMR